MTANRDAFLRELQTAYTSNGRTQAASVKGGKQLGYIREPGVLSLSYSMWQTLHSCPRKFLLREIHQRASSFNSTHLSFGSAFGAGLAEVCRSNDLQLAVVLAFAHWDFDDFSDGGNRGKTFWECVESIKLFHANIWPQLQEEWELAYIDGKPAIELHFYIRVAEGYAYQGHIDIILRNKQTNALAVVEVKSSARAQTEANWGNSDQSLGYYYVLTKLQEQLGIVAEPETIYIVLEVGKWHKPEENWGFKIFPFQRTEHSLLEFSNTLLCDLHQIQFYVEHNYFPKRGNSCTAYGRTCEFYGICDNAAMQDPTHSSGESRYAELGIEAADLYYDMREG
jgi:hypothetical protein